MEGNCPYCGSSDWDYNRKIHESYELEFYWSTWSCHCYDCGKDFKRTEKFELTRWWDEEFEDGEEE